MNPSDDDPAPRPPVRPHSDECCRSGCVPCVFDLYEEQLELYRVALKRWQQRQVAKEKPMKSDTGRDLPC
jgi:hypothetical protein